MEASTAAPPNRRERKAIQTRRTILDSARFLFERDGYGDTTVDEIANHADIASRTFFRYFPTKESLLFADFDDARDAMIEALEGRPGSESLFDSLATALGDFAMDLEDRWDDIGWGYKFSEEYLLEGSYERTMMRQHLNARIAAFIASRLAVEVDADPRPQSWAMAIVAAFGSSMSMCVASTSPRKGYAVFIETLNSTQQALCSMSEAASAHAVVAAQSEG